MSLTQDDFNNIRQIVKEEVTNEVNVEIGNAVKFLPLKDEFYTKMDEVMGELKGIREELTLMSGRQSEYNDQIEDHEIRIKTLEKHSSGLPTSTP